MSDQTGYTVSQVGNIMGVDPMTVRRWAAWHSQHFSASANPAKGEVRLFTARDLGVIREIKALRATGLLTPAINEQLQHITITEILPAPPVPVDPSTPYTGLQGAPVDDLVLRIQTDITQPLQGVIDDQGKRITLLEQSIQSSITLVAVGFVVGMVIMGLLVLIVLSLR